MRINRRHVLKALAGFSLTGISGRLKLSDVDPPSKEEVKKQLEANIKGFSESIPDEEEEQNKLLREVSKGGCMEFPHQDLSIEAYSEGTPEAHEQAAKARHVAKFLNENLDHKIPYTKIDDVYDSAKEVAKYAPLVGSAHGVVNSCCAIQEEEGALSESTRERFYTSVLVLVAEISLFELGIGYQVAFRGTGFIANFGLVRIREIVGVRLYALILSEVHWALRAQAASVRGWIVRRTADLILMLTEEDLYEQVAFSQLSKDDLDYDFLDEKTNSDDSDGGIFDRVTEIFDSFSFEDVLGEDE